MLEPSHNDELPEIPAKRYFTIGEVSELCSVKPHVLRYWEQEFPQLKPVKRRGNRRYYQRDDVITIRQIRGLLYDQGFTIAGARQHLFAQLGGSVGRLLQILDVRPGRRPRVELGQRLAGIAQDPDQEIVEVVRDPSRHEAEASSPLTGFLGESA